MRICDILANSTPTFSFEFFPPKDDEGAAVLAQTIRDLSPLSPSYVSVTYGAGGSTRRRTVEIVKSIKSDSGIEAMAHLTCVGATKDEISSVLDELDAAGVQNVLALRGDPPKGENEFRRVEGGFGYANELIEYISGQYDFCLGAACYPEKHPEAPSMEADLENLKRKVDQGARFLVTQLFFDNDTFFRFRDRAVAEGITVPIIAGIMPVLNGPQVKRFTSSCGATIPQPLLSQIEEAGEDAAQVRRLGVEHATRQCKSLLENGVSGIHFYTLNRSKATREIWEMLKNDGVPAMSAGA